MISVNNKRNQRGNALFLILIAVALFAALSYAVTQSGRGSGSISRETGLINSSQLTQYPAAVRTSVTRLILTGSTVTQVTFDPTDVSSNGVFSSTGGGVVAQAPPASGVDTTAAGTSSTYAGPAWRYKGIPTDSTKGEYIFNIGSDAASTGHDAFAFVGVNSSTCQSINKGLGLSAAPIAEGGTTFDTTTNASEGFPVYALGGPGPSATNTAYSIGKGQPASTNAAAQAFSCVSNANNANGPFIYYHAMVEQ
jgi:hypothetical protein